MMYGTAIKIAAFLRPILSAKIPDGTAPIIAPIAKHAATHPASSSLISMAESSFFNWSNTGEVHARPVPAAAAPKQTFFEIKKK